MKEFHPPTGNESTSDFAGDPLERLVEAFVEQSVPTGPDAATRRRMLAAMEAASSPVGLRLLDLPAAEQGPREPKLPRARHWLAIAGRQVAGIAAAILIVVAAALYTMSRHDNQPTAKPGGNPSVNDLIARTPPAAGGEADPVAAMPRELVRLFDNYLRTHGGQAPDRRAFNELVATLLRDNPSLADSPSWRFAQARLSYALEQPEVIGVGVVLGTLPWKTYASF